MNHSYSTRDSIDTASRPLETDSVPIYTYSMYVVSFSSMRVTTTFILNSLSFSWRAPVYFTLTSAQNRPCCRQRKHKMGGTLLLSVCGFSYRGAGQHVLVRLLLHVHHLQQTHKHRRLLHTETEKIPSVLEQLPLQRLRGASVPPSALSQTLSQPTLRNLSAYILMWRYVRIGSHDTCILT